MMKNPYEAFPRNPWMMFWIVVLIAATAVISADAFGGPRDPHGGLSRADFIAAKTLSASGKANNGELGDAAVTSDRYDVLRYGLDLRIVPSVRHIEGAVTMVFSSLYDGLTDVVFDLRDALTVDSVDHLTGALPFTHEGDSVVVTLPAALSVGQQDSIVVRYGGDRTEPLVNRGLMFRTYRRDDDSPAEGSAPIVANMSQPAFGQAWWPCKDKPGDKFLLTVDLTVPEDLIAVSNGSFLGDVPAGSGWRTYSWSEAHPIATYLVSVAVSEYDLLTENCLTTLGTAVPLTHYVFPKDREAALVEFARVCDMLDFCEGRFGAWPFIGEKYGHAEFIWNGAMEHQTITSIGHGSFDPPGGHQWLVMHELAHQWFGDSLTPAKWSDIWLNEGFATYSEALWEEEQDGHAAYLAWFPAHRFEEEWVDQGPVYDPYPVFPGRVIYDKGAWILHVLRGRMGDAAFFGLLEEWGDGGGRPLSHVVTEEFIALADTWAGESLGGLLWPYLTTTTLPALAFSYEIGTGNAGEDTRVSVQIRQTQNPIFDLVMPVSVTTSAGTEVRRVHLAGRSLVADLEFDAPAIGVALDPDGWVLWNKAGAGSGRGLTLAYPNPAAGEVTLRYGLPSEARVVLRIVDAYGREVYVRDLGTVSPEAAFNEVVWDGRGGDGRRAPSGVYWAALEIAGRRSVGKFSLVR